MNRKAKNAYEYLEHARWYLLYGGDVNFTREPNADEKQAAALLKEKMDEVNKKG